MRPQLVQQLAIDLRHALLRITAGAKVELNRDDSFGPESGLDVEQLFETASEQNGSDQEHKRHRDLRDYQGAAQAEALASAGDAASSGAHRRSRGDARGAHRWSETEQQAGEDGNGRHEGEDAQVELQS